MSQLKVLDAAGARAFVGVLPLTGEGSILRLLTTAEDSRKEGHMIVVPPGCLFWHPATAARAFGFRTGPMGNAVLQFVLILLPSDKVDTVMSDLGQESARDVGSFCTALKDHQSFCSDAAFIINGVGI